MRKIALASLALAGTLALTGCGTSSTATPAAQTPVANQTAQTPAVTPAAVVVTGESIAAKLTAAGMQFVQKDKTTAAQAMKNGSAIAKSTEFKITVPGDMVVLSVNELSDPSKAVAVESDMRMQFGKATEADANIMAVMAKMNSTSTLVGVIYKTANQKDAWKVMDAIGAE